MKLISFRIKKYKRIDDTGWVDVSDFVGLVGKNEVGKSSIFKALSKLKNSENELFDKETELPILEIDDLENELVIPVSAKFKIEEGDPDLLKEKLGEEFIVGRDFDNNFVVLNEEGIITENEIKSDIEEYLPQFIYFDKYDVLDGSFNLVKFQNDLNADPTNSELRIKKCIFEFTGLEPLKLNELLPTKDLPDDENNKRAAIRDRRSKKAARKLTQEFKNWWPEEGYTFHFVPDAETFIIRVSDCYDPDAEIELKERSTGLQYFFSFFVIFLVESTKNHTNSILLLDEPGLHFHGRRQADFLRLFKELSKTNQFFYTTHSPFLIDPTDNYEHIRVVHSDKKNGKTIVAPTGTLPDDKDAIYPLEMNWYHTKFQDYILNKPHILLEGDTDVLIFEKINELMFEKSPKHFIQSVVFLSGNGDNSHFLLKLLQKHKIDLFYFVDGDTKGLARGEDFQNDFNIQGYDTKKYVKKESSIEDIFPEEIYLQAFEQVYEKPSTTLDIGQSMITKKLDKYLGDRELKKYTVTIQLLKIIDSNTDPIIEKFKPIFEDFKKLIEQK